jgi:hypothetical protein
MKGKQIEEQVVEVGTAAEVQPDAPVVDTEAVAKEANDLVLQRGAEIPVMKNVDDVFNRVINTRANVKTITFKRTLTKPLVAMGHTKQLLLKVSEELYKYELPVKGRSEKMMPATILEGTDVETGEDVMLICTTMMASALERAGAPLKGRCFAFREQGMKADKAYRVVDVVEVEVE